MKNTPSPTAATTLEADFVALVSFFPKAREPFFLVGE
jgi:hypothetical protein